MKALTLILIALNLTACGHAQTTMDREIALKLADRQIQVIQAQAPAINVNNYIAPTQARQPQTNQNGQVCTTTPIYNLDGSFSYNDTQCF